MEQYITNLGQRLKELRKSAGLTQEELAQQLGVQQSYIAKIEGIRESKQPTITFLITVCTYFGIGIDDLLGFNPPPPRNVLDSLSPEVRAPIEELIRQLDRQQRGDRWRSLSNTVNAVGGRSAVERGSRELGVAITPDDEPEVVRN